MTRVCLLTGASGRLGAAFAERYADRYQIVAVHGRRPLYCATQNQVFVDPLDPTRAISEETTRVYGIRADISRPSAPGHVVREALSQFGQVDLLVNAAAARHVAPLLDPASEEQAAQLFAVNVIAPARFTLSLTREFWARDPDANLERSRNVVNVSCASGLFVQPDAGEALYGTSKAALHHLTYHLASELWDVGIRVNAVVPDAFPTEVPAEDVLEAIVALDDSEQTGQLVRVTRARESRARARAHP